MEFEKCTIMPGFRRSSHMCRTYLVHTYFLNLKHEA